MKEAKLIALTAVAVVVAKPVLSVVCAVSSVLFERVSELLADVSVELS